MIGIQFNKHITHIWHLCTHGFAYLFSQLRRLCNGHLWVNFDAQFHQYVTSMLPSCYSSHRNSWDRMCRPTHRFQRLGVEITIEEFMAGFHADLQRIEQDEKSNH